MIVQNASSTGTTDLSFTLHKDDSGSPRKCSTRSSRKSVRGMTATTGVAKLSVVGIGMRSHAGVASRLFACLGEAGVNIQLISTSEIKIAVVVDENELDRPRKATHAAFGLAQPRAVVAPLPAIPNARRDRMAQGQRTARALASRAAVAP